MVCYETTMQCKHRKSEKREKRYLMENLAENAKTRDYENGFGQSS